MKFSIVGNELKLLKQIEIKLTKIIIIIGIDIIRHNYF